MPLEAFIAFTAFSYGTTFLISKPAVSVHSQKSRMLALFVFKSKMLQVLRTSFWVLLRVLFRGIEEFYNLFFQLVLCNDVVIGDGIFPFTQAQANVLTSRLLCIFTSLLLV